MPRMQNWPQSPHLPLAIAALGLTCLALPPNAHAQDEGGPLLSPVELKLQNAGTDEQLIKLARAAKINIMADASDEIDEGQKLNAVAGTTLTVTKKQTVVDWLHDMTEANHLTWQDNGSRSVVLWRAPNMVPLTRRVVEEAVAQRPQLEAEIKPLLQTKLDPALLARLEAEPDKWSAVQSRSVLYVSVVTDALRTLLQEKHGWDGRDQNFRLQLKDDQIPADLRSQFVVWLRLLQTQPDHVASRVWLEDATWQKARLIMQQTRPMILNGKKLPVQWNLEVRASVNGQEERQSVATLTEEGGDQ